MRTWWKKWKRGTRETNNIEREREREREIVSHVPLLDEKAIKCMVLEKKKHELLSKYMGEDFMKY
jgi:hypothetical protein